jgi:hypothetical protein
MEVTMKRILTHAGATIAGILTILTLAVFFGLVAGLTLLAAGAGSVVSLVAAISGAAVTAGGIALAIRHQARQADFVPAAVTAGAVILTASAILPSGW